MIIVFTGCKKESSNTKEEFSNLFTTVDSIRLEFSSESIIRTIQNILFWKDKLFVMQNNAILKYDSNGKYLSKIQKIGDGPGEFRTITWATIRDNGELVIYDDELNRVTFYDTTLSYTHHYKLGEEIKFYQMFVIDSRNRYFFYNTNLFDNQYTIDQYDSLFNKQNSFCIFPYNSVVQLRLSGNQNLAYLPEKNILLVSHMYDPILKMIRLGDRLVTDSINITPVFWKVVENQKVKELFPDIGTHPQKLLKYLSDKPRIWGTFGFDENLALIEYWLPKNGFVIQFVHLDTKKVGLAVNIPENLGEVITAYQDHIFFAKYYYEKNDQNPTLYKYKLNHENLIFNKDINF
jgi:hypothetical protein